jgi:hypothetical protein
LVSLLLHGMHKAEFSKHLMSRAGLLKAKDFNLEEKSTNSILNEIFSIINIENLNLNKEEAKTNENQNSQNNNLIDLEEKTSERNMTEESVVNEEKKDADNLFENLTVRDNTKKETTISGQKQNVININTSPKKFYKDGSANLDNDFFNNFFGNFSQLQKNCDKELIDSILNVNSY